uniref:Uncharacterized protein n=1 Tax=Chromera velia CCMP2878 TaxID=1169474 RepID=A0A0G4GWL8_9ALVE|eukprot:Cvel_5316.t1-p1 / transcript=Cvel_5316.t1 / gene=Cvel_5316 / organism=Chromera_velia_CCMP2878 / gene_product=hypothetical protein / transcript_product=hypothetical protein / location=Cvel_scaffold246:63919-64338(+) / protein_length=140 / sequence_SO=supercontig / SO=protein_coding / is_pseudo=false
MSGDTQALPALKIKVETVAGDLIEVVGMVRDTGAPLEPYTLGGMHGDGSDLEDLSVGKGDACKDSEDFSEGKGDGKQRLRVPSARASGRWRRWTFCCAPCALTELTGSVDTMRRGARVQMNRIMHPYYARIDPSIPLSCL